MWQEGKLKQYHSEISEIIRTYLEKRFQILALELPTFDILKNLKNKGISTGIHYPTPLPFLKASTNSSFTIPQALKYSKITMILREKNAFNIFALFNVKGQFHAIDNICPHRQGPLAYGEMIDEDIFCPIHRAQFNIPTGKCVGPKDKPWYPEMKNVSTYQVRINGDDIEIEV